MNENAVTVIRNYVNENLFIPARNWSDYEFKRRSYERWAAHEIIKRVDKTPEKEPFFIILYFRYQMDALSSIREDSDAEFIFITARDTADEILELF
ncbi:MAG: hypothetical protein Q4G33_07755 [bacterium]|nr:hypothetical protein [bacterium]